MHNKEIIMPIIFALGFRDRFSKYWISLVIVVCLLSMMGPDHTFWGYANKVTHCGLLDVGSSFQDGG